MGSFIFQIQCVLGSPLPPSSAGLALPSVKLVISLPIKFSSTMAELGMGVQKNGWGFAVGANWTDGGAFKSTVGGQAIIRFAW